MHTKGNGERLGGSWSVRLGMVALGLSLGLSLTSSPAAAESCVTIIGCSDNEEPPATTTTTTAPPPPPAAPELSSAEAAARLLSLLNDERAHAGLAPFAMRADVTEIAAGWSGSMAQSAHLSHNDAYFTKETRRRLDARMLGENVARNPSVDGAHRALMASPPHRANILDGRFVVIGIGAELRDGSWWVTQDFVQPGTAGATSGGAASASGPVPAQPAPSTTAPRPAAGSGTPQSTTSAPTTAPGAEDDNGQVLAAAASAPSVVDLAPGSTSEAGRSIAAAVPSSPGSRLPVAAVAAGLLGLVLLAGGRVRRAVA